MRFHLADMLRSKVVAASLKRFQFMREPRYLCLQFAYQQRMEAVPDFIINALYSASNEIFDRANADLELVRQAYPGCLYIGAIPAFTAFKRLSNCYGGRHTRLVCP